MDDKGKELCPRLIDFLVIVGRRPTSKLKLDNGDNVDSIGAKSSAKIGISNPELLRRYPTDDHKDFHLPTDVTYFCQPEGCITVNSRRRLKAYRDTTSFVFTLTDKDSGKTRYGVTLNFFLNYERNHKKDDQSLRPIGTKKKSPIASLTSLCLMSHHPFLSAFRDMLTLLRQLIDACNHRCNQNEALPRDAVWAVLIGHWIGDVPSQIMQEIRQIETWILMLLSSPVPVPGKTKVVLEILPLEIMPMIEFALPDHTRFSLIDFPLHLPIELLGVNVVVKLLAAVMLEHKVVLQSRNYNAVSMCVMALVALLYPLEYMFPVIPLLPVQMPSAEQLLLAPTPFIIGVPSSFFAVKKIESPSDVVLVDLDTNEMTCGESLDQIPAFPEPQLSALKDDFRRALGKMTMQAPNIEGNGHRGSFESSYTIDGDEIDVACRVSMIKFFNSSNIFANFSEHCRTLRLYPRPVVALQTESFLRSRPLLSNFIQELCKTQSVEYFAECSLCPKNETYVRVHTGITAAPQIGDKAKWFTDQLMPIHFNAYPDSSTLSNALHKMKSDKFGDHSDSEDDDVSDMEANSGMEESAVESPYADNASNFEASKPLSEVNDVYKAPKKLEFPQSESALSIDSSISSGRSSRASSISASAADSEADFARLAENLALKSDSKGDFSFDHSATDDAESTPVQSRRGIVVTSKILAQNMIVSNMSTPTTKNPPNLKSVGMKGLHSITDSGEKVFGPQLMNAINGYAEKSHGMLSQVLNKTAPKAQALRDKTMRPLAEAAANKMEHGQHLINKKSTMANENNTTANQQSKNQQMIREICDQIQASQGIGVFTYPKIKRLLEDESLRELVCSKLNTGLDLHYTEDDFLVDRQLTKSQYKGYLKIFQACISGLEQSYNTPGSHGLASMFHVLEIAHSHYWSESDATTPGSGTTSIAGTPSVSMQNLAQYANTEQSSVKLPATQMDSRQMPGGSAIAPPPPPLPSRFANGPPTSAPPPLPPRPPPPQTSVDNPASVQITESPLIKPEEDNQAPLLSEKQETTEAPKKLTPPQTLTPKQNKPTTLLVEPPRQLPDQAQKHYLFRDLIGNNSNPLWQQMVFWENAFFDMVAQERDIIGMDQEPSEMIDRYSGLSDSEKKRLELDEDRILATLLHNMTAYMVMCNVPLKTIQQKVRRLLGKAHIGLIYSKKINQLLDELSKAHSNNIPLKPLGSRLTQKQSFTVSSAGSSADGVLMFLEVTDDAVIIRATTGAIIERWWYERLVNMTYSPKTRILCLWRRQDDQVHMHKFYTKKCRTLYNCLKAAMERAAARGKVNISGRDLGGEFPVNDIETNEGGLLQVRMDGIALLFDNRQEFVDLSNIKKCNTFGGNMFVLEEYNKEMNELIQRRYISKMAVEIAWTLHRVFSVQAALIEETDDVADTLLDTLTNATAAKLSKFMSGMQLVLEKTGYPSESRVFLLDDF